MVAYVCVPAAAFVAGMVNSIAGGGTFLTFPVLTGIGGLSEKVANMTSTLGLVPGSASAVVTARKEIAAVPRSMIITYGIISLLGGAAGSLLLIFTPEREFSLIIPWLLALATTAFAFSKPIARWAGRKHGDRSLKWTLLVGLIQVFIALYGGYFGAGAGVLMLAGLAFAGLDNIHQMNALKVLLGTLINTAATVIFLFSTIQWPFALLMAVSSSLGGYLGIRFARSIKPDNLRRLILFIGLALTVVFFYKAYFYHAHVVS